jgi:hypothetical protein
VVIHFLTLSKGVIFVAHESSQKDPFQRTLVDFQVLALLPSTGLSTPRPYSIPGIELRTVIYHQSLQWEVSLFTEVLIIFSGNLLYAYLAILSCPSLSWLLQVDENQGSEIDV